VKFKIVFHKDLFRLAFNTGVDSSSYLRQWGTSVGYLEVTQWTLTVTVHSGGSRIYKRGPKTRRRGRAP